MQHIRNYNRKHWRLIIINYLKARVFSQKTKLKVTVSEEDRKYDEEPC